MCKKLLYGLLASVMLLATSCIFEEPIEVPTTDEAQVSFMLSVENGVATRTISDGTGATKLIYAIYKINVDPETKEQTAEFLRLGPDNGQFVVQRRESFVGGEGKTPYQTDQIALAKGQAYCAVFWAQNPNTSAYTTTDLTDVKVNYGTGQSTNNNEARDAFFASLTFIAADGLVQDVTLRRPFAQINVGVYQEDWNQAVAAGFVPEKSSVKIKNAATSINLLTGEVGDETTDVEVNYVSAAIPNEPLMVDIDGDQTPESYKWLSMSYILVPDHSGEKLDEMLGANSVPLESAEFTFSPKDGEDIVLSDGLSNVPAQRNWRTNIIGRILTGDVQFNITVDPSYYNDYYVEYPETYIEVAPGVKTKDGEDNVYYIDSPEGMQWLTESLADNDGFAGVTFKLLADIDLTGVTTNGDSFSPIGLWCSKQGVDNPFKGHFDGNGHTIKGLYQSGWDFGYELGTTGYLGLFGYVKDVTIENLTIEGMESVVEGGTLAAIAGRADGECTFRNITVKNTNLGTFNNRCGGIVGYTSGYYKDEAGTDPACHFTFENINICDDVVLGGLWGSFDSTIGGIMGQLNNLGSASFKNVTVSCRIDAYNDCTASGDYYLYRMCGMLIGRLEKTTVIDGSTYPDVAAYEIEFDNVKVNYGKWMNYHYCEPTPGLNGGRGMRIEPGFTYDGLPTDFDHTQCVDNHYNCIPFDQLIGGTQIACRGVKAWECVTVNYPAEYTCEVCGQQHNVAE